MQLYLSLGALFSLTVAIFAIQNSEEITIQFLFWQLPSFPLVMVILGAAFTGMLAAWFFGLSRRFKLSSEIREMKMYIDSLHTQLNQDKPKEDCNKTETREKLHG